MEIGREAIPDKVSDKLQSVAAGSWQLRKYVGHSNIFFEIQVHEGTKAALGVLGGRYQGQSPVLFQD